MYMAGPFGCLFGLVFGFLVFLFVTLLNVADRVRNVIRSFFPSARGRRPSSGNAGAGGQSASASRFRSSSKARHKVFDDDEGEYVDYEEVK